MARAEKYTITGAQPEYFSDITINFDKNPVTNNLARITNEEAVKQSIRNLIMTGNGERFYRPDIGSKIATLLFDPIDDVTTNLLKSTIEHTIRSHEPRARLNSVTVRPSEDENVYEIGIDFSIVNISNRNIFMGLSLSRVR